MKASFHIQIDIDPDELEREARRHGRSTAQALADVVGDCECRLFDSIRYRDAVSRVGVTVIESPVRN